MIEFYEHWSALFRLPLIGWTICAQLLAAVTVVALHFVAWRARRHAFVCVPLGALSLFSLSYMLFIICALSCSWNDSDAPAPPDFVDLTWLYFAGWETGFILLALGTAFLHRKQFALPLLRGFCGFFFDAAFSIFSSWWFLPTSLPFREKIWAGPMQVKFRRFTS